MSSPAVVFKSRFTQSSKRVFTTYIDYIDRDEATRNYKFTDFSLYNDYMGNPEKSGSIFTADKDYLSKEEKNNLKDKFKLAQKNGSLMWQDVFSFNNDWLMEHGYYDKETHILDEEKIRGAIRRCMNNHIDKSNMDTAIWSASFHYNTDNIHVHIATVELTNDPRERGKRTKSELSKMKSNFINELRHREKEYQKINEIMRENIVKNREQFLSSDDKVLKEKTLELLKKLPDNKRYWQYGYNKINNIKPLIDRISKYYIQTYHKEDYKDLMKRLTIEELELKRVYGEGKEGKEKGRYKDYKKNKERELLKKMGNSILRELREYVKKEEEKYKNKKIKKEKGKSDKEFNSSKKEKKIAKENFSNNKESINSRKEKIEYEAKDFLNNFTEENILKNIKEEYNKKYETQNKFNISINQGTINRLKKAMRNDLEKYLNKKEFEKAERIKEYEREGEKENELYI